MTEYKPIAAWVYDPVNIFSKKKLKSQCKVILCGRSDECPHYAQGKCIAQYMPLGDNKVCPDAKITFEEGYTQAARAHYDWMRKKREQYKDILEAIKVENERLCRVGGYVYLPYPHLTNYVNSLPFVEKSWFVKNEDFTLENVISIIKHRPRPMFGYGEIESYQREEVPKFVSHLCEEFPELFEELKLHHGDLLREHGVEAISYIGRRAYITTCRNGATFIDRGNKFTLIDGALVCDEYNPTFSSPFGIQKGKLRLYPTDTDTIKITDDNQVMIDTKYAD